MKFMHVGDTHIGKVFKDEQRNKDVKSAFKQVIDYAIANKLDFIVHAGDLFNEGDPSLNDLLFVTDELSRLKQSSIKLFIVPGSHDVGIGEEDSIIELFDRNGLLVNLNSKRYIKYTKDEVLLKGETYKNATICGVRGKRSRVEDEIFKKLRIEDDKTSWIKIFLFHHTISSLGEQFKDLDIESLPKGFDYYAAGHWHGHKGDIRYGEGVIQYPGSTEYCDEKEMVDNPNRGFYVVEYGEKGIENIEYITLETREREIIRIDAEGKKVSSVESEIYNKLAKNSGKLLIIKLVGKLDGHKGELALTAIKEKAAFLGYSYTSINTSKLSDKDGDHIEFNGKDAESIEKEFLKSRGYDEKTLALADFFIHASEMDVENATMLKKINEVFQ